MENLCQICKLNTSPSGLRDGKCDKCYIKFGIIKENGFLLTNTHGMTMRVLKNDNMLMTGRKSNVKSVEKRC